MTSTRRAPHHFRIAAPACLLALIAVLAAASGAAAAPRTPGAAATHIVQFRGGVSPAAAAGIVRRAGGRPGLRVPLIDALGARLTRREAARLARDPRVRAVSRNGRAVSQSSQQGLPLADPEPVLASSYPGTVDAPDVWPAATGTGITVAVIDTGVDGTRPDFQDATGASRVIGSAVVNPLATGAGDTYGHGTHVAGIIAGDGSRRDAADPQAGQYVGIAPDANLVSIKIADDNGQATVLDAIYGLQFAVDHESDYGIRIVNLSLASTVAESYATDPLDAAVEAAWFSGLVVVAAAGNGGTDPGSVSHAPGNDPYAITVGATDDQGTTARYDDVVASYSSRGTTQDGFEKPDVTAPGSHIVSTIPPGSAYTQLCPGCMIGSDYIRVGGTSMAAPVVSGIAALLLQTHPTWAPDQVKRALRRGAELASSPIYEVSTVGVLLPDWQPRFANQGLTPNTLVDPTTGSIDYARSSWSRSSWSAAPSGLTAGWARSSWSCDCSQSPDGTIDPARSSWSRSSWSTHWDPLIP
jgi:serine protease AprX